MDSGVNEKCAVGAISSSSHEVAAELYEVMYAQQHRGAEASGIVTQEGWQPLHIHRGLGLVRDVFNQEIIASLKGNSAVGHNRYTTSGEVSGHFQPTADENIGFSFAHNGNLPDTDKLASHLQNNNLRPAAMNDSEMMAAAIAQSIRKQRNLPDAIAANYELFTGAFSCVAVHDGNIVAFRDPKGIRPLSLGRTPNSVVVASETCGLDIIGAQYIRDVAPGEMIIIDGKDIESQQLAEPDPKLDMFELVYFARHDSYLQHQSVNEVRRRFGEQLAEEHGPLNENTDNIVVVPVPDTSVPAAEGYAQKLGLIARQALIKNRYIGRTFMQTSQEERRTNLRRKHNIIPEAVEGRDVVLIDDSIVRFNTIPNLVELTKESGAKSVSVLVASPPVRFPDFYGIDTPTQQELVAANQTIEEMRQAARCEYLGYLSLKGMLEATGLPADQFNLSCFTGEYPIDIGRRAQEIKPPVSMRYAE